MGAAPTSPVELLAERRGGKRTSHKVKIGRKRFPQKVEQMDNSEPSTDVTNIKVGQAYITWSGHSLDESGTRVVWTCM